MNVKPWTVLAVIAHQQVFHCSQEVPEVLLLKKEQLSPPSNLVWVLYHPADPSHWIEQSPIIQIRTILIATGVQQVFHASLGTHKGLAGHQDPELSYESHYSRAHPLWCHLCH